MAECPNCSENVNDDEQFCPKCGQLVKSVKNVKEYINTESKTPKVKIVKKKDNKLKQAIDKFKSKLPKKLDKKTLVSAYRKSRPYIIKALHPLKALNPLLFYAAKHKYVFFLVIFLILSSGSYFANELLTSEPKAPTADYASHIQPLPSNGILSRDSNEPLRSTLRVACQRDIKTYYLFKIVDINKGVTTATAFLYPGEALNISLPIGIYEVRYASGTNWYGMGRLFGPDTYYGKAVENVDLSFPGYPYSIEMYGNYGGNLRTDQIKKEQF